MYKLIITDSYHKKAHRFFGKNPQLLLRYEKALELLCNNPFHPSLRLHSLSGQLKGLSSVSIALSYRLIVYFIIKQKSIIPVDIGSHDDIY